jgi:photosynthetic reaction center H subunit
MGTGAVTGYIDLAQITLYLFWAFFAGLVYYLHQENKREGYPLESDRSPHVTVQGWPPIPAPKTFLLRDGSIKVLDNSEKPQTDIAAVPTANFLGAPLSPTGNPMLDGVGAGAWAARADVPDTTYEGDLKIVPLRAAPGYGVLSSDPDPRGLEVIGADGQSGGTVVDIWVDRSEKIFRYLEVEASGGARRVLLPINFCRISASSVKVRSILGHQFAHVPGLRQPEQVTFLEEEKVMAYYGGGVLYAEPSRQEPIL